MVFIGLIILTMCIFIKLKLFGTSVDDNIDSGLWGFALLLLSVCNGIHLRCNVILLCQIFCNAYALVSRSLKSLQRLCIMPALQLFIMLLPVPPLFFSASFLLQIITFYPLNTSGSGIHATTLYGSPCSSNQTPVWE